MPVDDVRYIHTQRLYLVDPLQLRVGGALARIADVSAYVIENPLASASTHIESLTVPRIYQPIDITPQCFYNLLSETMCVHFRIEFLHCLHPSKLVPHPYEDDIL